MVGNCSPWYLPLQYSTVFHYSFSPITNMGTSTHQHSDLPMASTPSNINASTLYQTSLQQNIIIITCKTTKRSVQRVDATSHSHLGAPGRDNNDTNTYSSWAYLLELKGGKLPPEPARPPYNKRAPFQPPTTAPYQSLSLTRHTQGPIFPTLTTVRSNHRVWRVQGTQLEPTGKSYLPCISTKMSGPGWS